MRVLVTGGAGFIGSNVADRFIESGHEVEIIDDLSTGFRENVDPRAVFHELSITSPEAAELVLSGRFDILCPDQVHYRCKTEPRCKKQVRRVVDRSHRFCCGI